MAQAVSEVPMTRVPRGFKLTRTLIFGVVFLLAGLLMLSRIPSDVSAEQITTLTFGDGIPNVLVPTQMFGMIVGAVYLIAGVVALIPVSVLPNIGRSRETLLIIAGVLIIPITLILAGGGRSVNITQMLESTFRLATPITLGALAGLWCEKSGVTNIASESMMLTGACFGFIGSLMIAQFMPYQSALGWGVLVAVVAGGLIALLHGWLSITFMTDQVVSGTVINILAIGLTSFMRREVLLSTETARETLSSIAIPILSDIPVIGKVFFTGKPIYLLTFVLVIVTHVVMYNTRWGLRTRAVGENPHAADTLGINVVRNRYINVFIGGLIAGLAGAWFSIETVGLFEDQMTGGLGFIGLAAMIFGKWTPGGAMAGALLFGFARALDTRFQSYGVPIPSQFIQMLPNLVTMIVLAGLVGRAVAPKADGVPYKKE